jgi:polar amino acid transport system substrate-binding protein
MKGLTKIATLGILFILSSNLLAKSVSIRADEWFPINGVPGASSPGYMIELAQIILKEHGYTVDYQVSPWERSLYDVRKGNADCVVGAFTEDAPDFIFPKESWGKIESTFYVKKGTTWKYEGIKSLMSAKVGTIGGYAYSEEFDAYVVTNSNSPRVQVIKGNNALENNINKLLSGRIDTLIESHLVMMAKLKDMGKSSDIMAAGLLAPADDMYIACSPAKANSKELVQWFSDGLTKLRDSGELQKLLNKYGLKDWK